MVIEPNEDQQKIFELRAGSISLSSELESAQHEICDLTNDRAEILDALEGMVSLVDAHGWGEGPRLRQARKVLARFGK